MHRYHISKTKVVIIPLDGVILDLNRYRYNYYNHLCNDNHVKLDKYEFYSHLSNMYDMYKDLPLGNLIDVGPLNAKIERELFQYLSHKGIQPKEGFNELIEYLHQRDIQVAVISTHRTKDAIRYLQKVNLYDKVQFIIGSDSKNLPLPSPQMLENIMDHFHVKGEETLVISSFICLNKVANQLDMNIIFCEDFITAGMYERETSYKIVSNLFEVLNTLLFDKYEEADIYSSILGMTEDMNREQLIQVREKLIQKYQNDSQILKLIEQTYEYHISKFNEHNIKDGSIVSQESSAKVFSFDTIDFHEENVLEEETTPIDEIVLDEEKIEEDISSEEEKIDEIDNHLNDITDNQIETSYSALHAEDEDKLTMLLQQINKKDEEEITDLIPVHEEVEETDEMVNYESHEEINGYGFISIVINIIYIFAISFLILFVGLIVYISFIHQFQNAQGLFAVISHVFGAYTSLIEVFISSIFNLLHALIPFVPSYQQYETANAIFSMSGVQLFNIFIFHSLLIGFIKLIISIVRKDSDNEEISQ